MPDLLTTFAFLRWGAVMRHAVWSTCLVVLGMTGAASLAQAEDRNVLVLPVKTDLQRTAMGIEKNAKACVLVNSDGLSREDNALHWASLDFETLRKALLPYKEGKEPAVVFQIYHQPRQDEEFEQFRKLLRWPLVGFGQEMGFRPARWIENGALPWSERVAAIEGKTTGKADSDEPATGNELVTVYPVRTILSRHLFMNADCVVTIAPALTEDSDGGLPPKVEDALRRYVPELKLEDKGMLLFRIRCKLAAREASEKFYKSQAKALATSLGFESHNVQTSFER